MHHRNPFTSPAIEPMPDISSSTPNNGSLPPRNIYSRTHLNETYSATNMATSEENIRRILKPGVYVPTLAFFNKDTEELDEQTIAEHAVRMAKAGVAGLIIQGTQGEYAHLSHKERCRITRTTRHAVASAGYTQLPIIVGCGAQSTGETIELCQDAHASGGDYAIILPPSVYKAYYSKDTIKDFFTDVANASPIPILIYNFPAGTGGIELDSDTIIELAEHPNTVGCKLSCGKTGSLNRIASATRPLTPTDRGDGFLCLGGYADIALQSLIGGASGIASGLANLAPKTVVRLVELYHLGRLNEARLLQEIVARADWIGTKYGICAFKSSIESYFGYGGFARRPLPRPTDQEAKLYKDAFSQLVDIEKSL